MLITEEIQHLISLASFARWFFIALATLGMLVHRSRFPRLPRPFKVNLWTASPSPSSSVGRSATQTHRSRPQVPLVMAVTFTAVCFFIVGLSLYSDPWNTGRSCALTLTGVPVYYAAVHRSRLPPRWRRLLGEWRSKREDAFLL